MSTVNQWREIHPPQKPPVPEMRLDGPDMSYVSVNQTSGPEDQWWLYLSCSSGKHVPRVEGEPHPLGAALDYAIEHSERVLAWLGERRAELPEGKTVAEG